MNVADQKSLNANATLSPTLTFAQQAGSGLPLLSLLFNPTGSRNLTENWSLLPVTDIDNLRASAARSSWWWPGRKRRTAIIAASCWSGSTWASRTGLDCVIPTGWFHFGCHDEVPECACYVGSYCGTYVWVMPDDMDGLTRFTMTIIDLATGKPHAPTKTVVRTYKADGTLDNTQVTTTEIDAEGWKRCATIAANRTARGCTRIRRW